MSMHDELTYLMITPYALLKSRTGGIIGRLLSLAQVRFVAARMLAPDDEFVDAYLGTVGKYNIPDAEKSALISHIQDNIRPENRLHRANRGMLLLFEGRNAVEAIREVTGPIELGVRGDNIRGTYGDFITLPEGGVMYFEPAVLGAEDPAFNSEHLAQVAELIERTPGVLDDIIRYPDGVTPQTTLVMLKPDLFADRSARPGNIIDMFSRTGLYIVGAKVVHMSISQALEFYGFLEDVFRSKLVRNVAIKIAETLETNDVFPFPITPEEYQRMASVLAAKNAREELHRIIQYMTGYDPDNLPDGLDTSQPGRSMCLALLYQGENAVRKIRDKLGATDPSKAPGGTVRRDYGADLMRNGAHASDSPQNALRERQIIGLRGDEPPEEARIIREYLARCSR